MRHGPGAQEQEQYGSGHAGGEEQAPESQPGRPCADPDAELPVTAARNTAPSPGRARPESAGRAGRRQR
ncbi:hypothetical protein GCM10010298_11170 [Streptomyces microflavus]|nr:hypothetical protein GCM10010298_11170 [Streptomyces microflavus]